MRIPNPLGGLIAAIDRVAGAIRDHARLTGQPCYKAIAVSLPHVNVLNCSRRAHHTGLCSTTYGDILVTEGLAVDGSDRNAGGCHPGCARWEPKA